MTEQCAFCDYEATNERDLLTHATKVHPERIRRPEAQGKPDTDTQEYRRDFNALKAGELGSESKPCWNCGEIGHKCPRDYSGAVERVQPEPVSRICICDPGDGLYPGGFESDCPVHGEPSPKADVRTASPSTNVEEEAREWLEREGYTPANRMLYQAKRSGTVCLDGQYTPLYQILAAFVRERGKRA